MPANLENCFALNETRSAVKVDSIREDTLFCLAFYCKVFFNKSRIITFQIFIFSYRYGDKTPKTFLGRLFGVVWILVGAIMLSLFTALFTNAMQAALDGTKCQDISSNEVGSKAKNGFLT